MATILYKDGIAHRVDPRRVQQHLAVGYTTTPLAVVKKTDPVIDSAVETSGAHTYPSDDKDKLAEWAKEHHGINLDKRKGLDKLITEVDAALAQRET
jgi:hypothetical protein